MSRLVEATYVIPHTRTRRVNGQTVRQRRYEITDLAVVDWTQSQKFYLNLAPPSADLVPVVTAPGEQAAYDPADRDRDFQQRLLKSLQQYVEATRRPRSTHFG